jgi:hypothetical protein
VRLVVNFGVTIMGEPLNAAKQNDVITYGASLGCPSRGEELVAEVNGRWSTRRGVGPVGTESRGPVRIGGRRAVGKFQVDAALMFGVTSLDPSMGAMAGVTYTFRVFSLPASQTPARRFQQRVWSKDSRARSKQINKRNILIQR